MTTRTAPDAGVDGSRHPLVFRLLALVLSSLLCLAALEVGFRLAGYEPIYSV